MNEPRRRKIVVVTGDVTIDWNIAQVQRTDSPAHAWSLDNLTHAFYHKGGAALLADLVEAVADSLTRSKLTSFEVRKVSAPGGQATPDDKRFHHSYVMWKPFKMDEHSTAHDGMVWRVSEFLGIRRARADTGTSGHCEKVADDSTEPDLIILDDANLGFRDHPECWPEGISSPTAKPWILLKMAPNLATGNLWNYLQINHPERVVALITASDLRRHAGVHISYQISWERTAQDLVWELLYNPQINGLAMFAHTVISFDTSGALLLSRGKGTKLEATLFFDPGSMENEWGSSYPGYMVGYTSCLAAGIARELVASASKPDLHRGIQAGINAMRLLHKGGYGYAGADLEHNPITFPASNIATKIVEGESCLATVPVSNPAEGLSTKADSAMAEDSTRLWTILETQNLGSLERIAGQIVREGLESALSGVPVGRYGKLVTVDRKEIESLNCIGNLLREYCQQPQKTPLSIAVFGPPGAGKSFAVKQVANSVRLGEIDTLTFNVSQLGKPDDLLDAFHQVRDKVLSGKIPLVFWDEFDTTLDGQPLGWLRYFLAPMQDGEFQEGQIIHPIGKSIFVFAGGTSYSMEAFAAKLGEAEYQNKKLPDFISRLRGFLNILGPNCQENNPAEDPYYIIRRAILLRSILERNTPQLLRDANGKRITNIDEGVVRALLLTKEYKHGARSLEGIILTSQLAGKTSFERSSLPTEAQLNLHVDGREFYSLVHIMEPDKNLLEKLAEAAHEVFCDHLRAEGYRYGPETREEDKVHDSLKHYRELSENEKEQNRNNVRDIPNKLASIGYTMIPARGKEPIGEFSDDEATLLARMEHERWMREKIDTGWKYAKKTAKSRKRHKLLLPWEDLPPEEKAKDYSLVKGIPQILAKAGYTMVRLS
jgi:hypothetical protein